MLINDASITGSLIVNASSSFQNIAVSGNILPGTNNVYNLGSADKYFKEIFVSTGSINFVDNTGIKTTITSVAGGGIQIGSVQITTSSISFVDSTGSVTQNIAQSSSAGSTSNYIPTASFNEYTQSVSSSVASSITSSIATISSSVTTTITTLSSSVSTSFSSSAATITSLSSSVSASVTSLSSSLTSVNTTQNNRLGSIESATGSYSKLSGGNTFTGVQIISGSTFIAGDLIVQGSSSIQYISASSVSIGTNTINLNTNTPAVRFAGISIFDSGSNAQTASIFWDGLCNKFIYSNPSSVGYSGGMLISGPRNTGSMGDESGLTCNTLATSIGSDHISSSAIFHDPTTTCFYNSTTINSSGILTSTNLVGTICARNGVVSGSSQVDLTTTTNYASGILTRLNAVGVFSGSSQVSLSGFNTSNLSENTNLYYTDARVKTKLNAETVVSGSGQVAIASTSGFGTYINQALLTTSSPTFAGLTINTGGTGTWGPVVVQSTCCWGDGATQYATIGAGAAGIMIFNPHVVWNGGNSAAAIRLGRSGGTSAGKYYEIGTGASDNFFIAKESLAQGTQLNINSSGNATFSGTLSASNLSGTNTGDQTTISGNAGSATTLVNNSSVTGMNFSGVFALAGSGASTGNSTGARLSESYGAVWNMGNSSTWHHQVINGSSLVGISAAGTNFGSGNIYASGDVTAYYSDMRLKTKISNIDNALDKVMKLNGFYYVNNDIAKEYGYTSDKVQIGVSAQEIEAVLPEIVTLAPFDITGDDEGNALSKSGEHYKTVKYDKIVPLLIEAIKEQQIKIDNLTIEVENLKKPKGL